MRSKSIDAPLSKILIESAIAVGGNVPAVAYTAAIINFKVEKAGLFRLIHFFNAHHDGSGTLAGLNRQVYIDGIALYGQTEVAAAAQQYVHGITHGERLRLLGPGSHYLQLTLSCSVANIFYLDEGFIAVEEC